MNQLHSTRRLARSLSPCAGISAALFLLFSSPTPTFASAIDYLNLTAYSNSGNNNVGTSTYDTINGGSANDEVGSGTTNTYPSAVGLTAGQVQVSTTRSTAAGPVTGSAMAKGNLATGSIGVSAFPTQVFGNGVNTGSNTAGTAILRDSLTFNVAGANSSTITDIGVTFAVDGSVAYDPSNSGTAVIEEIMGLGGIISLNYDSTVSNILNSGWASETFVSDTPDSFIFEGVYQLQGASSVLPLLLELHAQCAGDASCDYSNTAAISFNLPSNVTFTSDSGIFLTQPLTSSATPEPSSLALLGTGMVAPMAIAVGRRRTRRCQ